MGAETENIPFVQLKVYDILGSEVATLINEEQRPGKYQVVFNAEKLSSGIYIAKLTLENKSKIISMHLIK